MSQATEWPALPLNEWQATYATLHMWTQIVGKVRLAVCSSLNHWWNVTLYVSPRGLTTTTMPLGDKAFELEFDFIEHQLVLRISDGTVRSMALKPRTVADFYAEFTQMLQNVGINIAIWTTPVEVAEPIPFEKDTAHSTYDPEYANRFWRVLLQSDRVMKEFRSQFLGKSSPVHFFWGSFDLAVTRFSGRPAPQHPGAPNVADHVTREAYSHEVSSCGFWPGGGPINYPAYYAYAYPEPNGFADWKLEPEAAFYDSTMHEFFLPYDSVRQSDLPDRTLMAFLRSTYEASAQLANWDRKNLER